MAVDELTTEHDPPDAARGAAERPGAGRTLWTAVRTAQVRLRFVAVFVVAFLLVGQWDRWTTYWQWLTRGAPSDAAGAVSADTEYFCPMCPGQISDWPNKCPVCNMSLVRRRKHEAVVLPEGVVARMQFSPYRLQLAGVRTSAVEYHPLELTTQLAGTLSRDQRDPARLSLAAALPEREAVHVHEGQEVRVECAALAGRGPWHGQVAVLRREISPATHSAAIEIIVDEAGGELWPGLLVTARLATPLVAMEPFRSQPCDLPPLANDEPRTAFQCPNHAGTVRLEAGRCPLDRVELAPRPLADNERLRWWCPLHPQVTAEAPGAACAQCDGEQLVPRIVVYRPPSAVLAVPDSAVIDDGERKIVYVERHPGMFDGVEVRVGPRADGYYAVAEGLSAGQRVVTIGRFLVDAESRLNPNAAISYFGASGSFSSPGGAPPATAAQGAGPSTSAAVPSGRTAPDGTADDAEQREKIAAALAKLAPADRALAERQRVCPVTGLALGSMGKPLRVVVAGRTVFVCCGGCETPLRKQPERYLSKLAE